MNRHALGFDGGKDASNERLQNVYSTVFATCALLPALVTSHVAGLNHAGVQVRPEEALVHVVDSEAVGPTHFIHQSHYVAPVHVGPRNPGPAPPLCPVHVAGQRQNTGVSTPHIYRTICLQ